MAIRIVTDSSSDLPPDLVQKHNITVLPCYVIFGDETRKDGVDITADDFYRQLESLPRLPTTAQPSAADFQEVYSRLLEEGHQILSIHVSGKLSGTLNSAFQAKAALDDNPAIEIVDSALASIPLGLAALDAAQWAEDATSLEQLASRVRESLPSNRCYFLLDTLEYLQKGGRIGKAQAFVGSLLSVKPILSIQEGEAHPVERPRSRDRGQRRLLELARNAGPVRRLAVIHSTDPDRAQELRKELTGLVPEDQIVSTRFGATLGTYLGPNALGVAITLQESP